MGRLTQLRRVPPLQELIYGVARICEHAHSFIYFIRSLAHSPSLLLRVSYKLKALLVSPAKYL